MSSGAISTPCSISTKDETDARFQRLAPPSYSRLDVHDRRQPQALGIEPGHCRRCWQTGGSTDLWHLAHLANRHCIVRTGNPVSYHLIVHLKAKGTATLWPDKVAVLHAWSRRSPSLGFSPLDRAIGRPRCSFDRGFTVTLPEPWPPAGRYAHAESGEGDARCSTSLSRHRHQSARCVGDSQGRPLNDPMAIRS